MYNFTGKIALVTGGAQGIGFHCAKELLRNGIEGVTLVDNNETQGNVAAKELAQEFGVDKAIFVQADVTKTDEFEAAFKATINKWKTIDILLNNAGIVDDAKWEKEIDINCGGVVRGSLLGFQYMGKDKGGNGGIIINTASRVSFLALSPTPVYAASKSFVMEFSRCISTPYHYSRSGVKVLIMCPGTTATPLLLPTGEPRVITSIVPDSAKVFAEEFKDDPPQSVENVAKGFVTIISEGKSGSIWLIAGNNSPHEIVMPDKKLFEEQ